jgi:hypothetical protein
MSLKQKSQLLDRIDRKERKKEKLEREIVELQRKLRLSSSKRIVE